MPLELNFSEMPVDTICPECGRETGGDVCPVVHPNSQQQNYLWIVTVEYAPNLGIDQIPNMHVRKMQPGENIRDEPPMFFIYTFDTQKDAETFVASY
jgi:hypothetical protein